MIVLMIALKILAAVGILMVGLLFAYVFVRLFECCVDKMMDIEDALRRKLRLRRRI